jgi:hypothetical protein
MAGAVGVIVQVPAVSIVTVVPETVQTLRVELAKVTTEPEVSLAVPSEKVPAPPATQVWEGGGVHVMFWGIGRTVTVRGRDDKAGLAIEATTGTVPILVPVMVSEAVPEEAVTGAKPEAVPVPPDCAKVIAPLNEVTTLL